MRSIFIFTVALCLLAGCATTTIRKQGTPVSPGTFSAVQISQGNTGSMPPEIIAIFDSVLRDQLDCRGIGSGSGALVHWTVERFETGSRWASFFTRGLAGSAKICVLINLTTPSGTLIQEFTTESFDNSLGARQRYIATQSAHAAAKQIAQVLGR